MSTLLGEYRKRNDINAVCPTNEGVLFFESTSGDKIVVLTSSVSKAASVGHCCAMNGSSIVCEIYEFINSSNSCLSRIVHTHCPPDADLVEYVKNHVPNGEQYSPVISKGDRQLEEWLWVAYIDKLKLLDDVAEGKRSNKRPFRLVAVASTDRFAEAPSLSIPKNEKSKKSLPWISQIMYVLQTNPSQFKIFYEKVYSFVLVGRKYILNFE